MDEIQTDAVLKQRVRGGMSDAEMGKGMTYEESIHKMLEQVLKNQIEILVWEMDPQRHNPKSTEKSIRETILLLADVNP